MISYAEAGLEEGLQKGLLEGRKEGIKESKKEVILNMYRRNMNIEDICDIVNLSKEEVQSIIKEES